MMDRAKALVALAILCLIWGYNWVLAKEGLRFSGPFDFAALRALPGSLLLFALLGVLRRPLAPKAAGMTLLLGLLQTTGFTVMMNLALMGGGAGKSAVLTYTMPFWTLLLAWFLLKERPGRLQIGIAGVAFLGLLLVLEPWSLAGSLAAKLFAVGTGISWALAAIVAKRMFAREKLDLLALTAWQMLFGGLALVVISLLMPSSGISWTPYFVGILLFNILFATALGWLIWLYILERLPAGTAGMSVLAVPVVGVVSSHLQLDETPAAVEWAGMLLIVGAIAALHWANMRRPRSL